MAIQRISEDLFAAILPNGFMAFGTTRLEAVRNARKSLEQH